jgi:SAM-dependent methyltransferase
MTTADELERFGRERREADRRYNDALTALDRAVVAASDTPPLGRDELQRLATTLILFLQQITAFVESKDREQAAHAAARLEAMERALEPVAELRARIGIMQRGMQALQRGQATPARSDPRAPRRKSITSDKGVAIDDLRVDEHADAYKEHADAYKYVGFEDQFRGSDAIIEDRQRAYVPILASATDVLDLGCGRGELLAALKAAGVAARGVDANADMVAIARARGLDADHADALAYAESLPDSSLGGAISTQVVEHLEPAYLIRLLDTLSRKLRAGAPIVIETINPACWLAFFSSYIRDFTHVRPVHHETLQFLLRASGFERVEIRFSAPVPDSMKMKTIDLPPDVLASTDPASMALAGLAHIVNANAVILNNLLFTYLDYAAIGYRA